MFYAVANFVCVTVFVPAIMSSAGHSHPSTASADRQHVVADREETILALLERLMRYKSALEEGISESFQETRSRHWKFTTAQRRNANPNENEDGDDVRNFAVWFIKHTTEGTRDIILPAVFAEAMEKLGSNKEHLRKVAQRFGLQTREMLLVFGPKVCGKTRTLNKLSGLVNGKRRKRTPEAVMRKTWEIVLAAHGRDDEPPVVCCHDVAKVVAFFASEDNDDDDDDHDQGPPPSSPPRCSRADAHSRIPSAPTTRKRTAVGDPATARPTKLPRRVVAPPAAGRRAFSEEASSTFALDPTPLSPPAALDQSSSFLTNPSGLSAPGVGGDSSTFSMDLGTSPVVGRNQGGGFRDFDPSTFGSESQIELDDDGNISVRQFREALENVVAAGSRVAGLSPRVEGAVDLALPMLRQLLASVKEDERKAKGKGKEKE
jgi:hypothetical protein